MSAAFPSRQQFSASPLPQAASGPLSPNNLNPGAPTFAVRSPSQSSLAGSFSSIIGPPPRGRREPRDGTTTPKANGVNGPGFGHAGSRSISSASDGADSLAPLSNPSALRPVALPRDAQDPNESVEFGDEFAPFDLGDEGLGMGMPHASLDREVSAARSTTSGSSYGGPGALDERLRNRDGLEDSPTFKVRRCS
jgi:hypothetical protein